MVGNISALLSIKQEQDNDLLVNQKQKNTSSNKYSVILHYESKPSIIITKRNHFNIDIIINIISSCKIVKNFRK